MYLKIKSNFRPPSPFSYCLSGVIAMSNEVTAPNAMVKHSLPPDRQIESPPKRPKSAEGKTSANEQVMVCRELMINYITTTQAVLLL